ncbi:MAG: toll/interleukin-1 receptor domain-containing protein [Elusimicrobia bacterium]|nr:toll/interleukin-1 receptor domain-containing protein [Elusimicrobiota bacterium]
MSRRVQIAAEYNDITRFEADAVVVRHTSGAAGAVAEALGLDGDRLRKALPAVGSLHVFPGEGRIAAQSAAFFRTVPPSSIDLPEVKKFSGALLRGLRAAAPQAKHLAMTLHGVMFGLRVEDALRAQLEGWRGALSDGEYPGSLERITVVSGAPDEAREISTLLRGALLDGAISASPPPAAAPAPAGQGFDVFISFKSEDAEHAARVYEFLTARGLRVFFSRASLPRLGSDEYHAQIDKALEQAKHLVLVTSSSKHASSQWVEYEWRLFLGEKLAGRKAGNVLSVLAGGMRPQDLPISLRNREALRCEPSELERLLEYLRDGRA